MRPSLTLFVLFAAALLRAEAAGLPRTNEIPFEFRDGFIWVTVQTAESTRPLHFLLDSGAGVSVLNLDTAKRLGLKLGKAANVQGVSDSRVGFWPEHLSATANQVPLPTDYLAVDLSALSGACECPVDGLLGADFFHNRVLQIDFVARKIRLFPAAPLVDGADSVPLKVRHGSFLVPVRVNHGSPRWARLDTGCASGLQWVTSDHNPKASHTRLAVALAQIPIVETQTTVQLGNTRFPAVLAGLHYQPIFPGEAGLLGNGVLSQFASVTIDAKTGRLLLQRRNKE